MYIVLKIVDITKNIEYYPSLFNVIAIYLINVKSNIHMKNIEYNSYNVYVIFDRFSAICFLGIITHINICMVSSIWCFVCHLYETEM